MGQYGRAMAPDQRPTAVVFDLDGVLADVRHRLHHVAARPRDWDAFFAAAPEDPVLPEGRAAVARALDGGHVVVYVTGRPERCRTATVDWLGSHGFPPGQLVMRPEGDHRPARVTKLVALRRMASQMRIAAVVDDDAAVVEVLRKAGHTVVHATWMDEASTSGGESDLRHSAQDVLFDVQEDEGRT